MRRVVALYTLMLCALASWNSFAEEPKGIVVWKLEVKHGVKEEEVDSVSGLLTSEVENVSGQQVISSTEINTILEEEELKQKCGVEDTSCMVEIGNALNVPEAISGDMGRVGSIWILNLRRIDVEQVRVIKRVTIKIDGPIEELVNALPNKVAELFNKRGQSPPATQTFARPSQKKPKKSWRKEGKSRSNKRQTKQKAPKPPGTYDMDNYPEPLSGPRLFAYSSVFLWFGFQSYKYEVTGNEVIDTGDDYIYLDEGTLTLHSINLTPGFSADLYQGKASLYMLTNLQFNVGDTDEYMTKAFRLTDILVGFNVITYNQEKLILTFSFDMEFKNANPSEAVGLDYMPLIPKLSAGMSFWDRLYVSPYVGFPIGIAITESLDNFFIFNLGVPLALKIVDHFYFMSEFYNAFYLAPEGEVGAMNFIPGFSFQTSGFSVKLGVPLRMYPDPDPASRWNISFYISSNM